ncbi:MAG TPA: SPFH domain-containing protein [Candidatus Aquilonibacter sp.]|nr:SPFH domain-containing protein [Candidatus Aquilonibacter sp.]
MLFLRFLLFLGCFGLGLIAAGMVLYDIFLAYELDRILRRGARPAEPSLGGGIPAPAPAIAPRRARRVIRMNEATKLVLIAAVLGLLASSIVVVPDGEGAVRISQISGVRPGTLYAGTHLIAPLLERVQLFDIRDRVFATSALENRNDKHEVLTVEAHEGLEIGLGVDVRYRIDPRKLDYIQANLPQPVEDEIVAPTVLSAFREVAPDYIVRDIFSTKREEFRQRVTALITKRLADDGIEVKEVQLRKVELPDEYAKGLEDLLLKEQEDDRTSVDAEIEKKRVAIAESQAEAEKVRDVKHAEANAASQVIMAKAESDAMQYTLPLKQKQIEQSRLEAEARKEATIQNAEADAQAKVIDGKAEQQRNELLADAEANRIRVTAKAEEERANLMAESDANHIRLTSQAQSEQMQLQAAALKQNPLLVQYTVAEKLSDKVQIMLVPNDGKFFFTNDVLKSAAENDVVDPPSKPAR